MSLPTPFPSSRSQTEHVIATARVVLAAASLFAIWIDPTEPQRYVPATYSLHLSYIAYALGLATLVWLRPISRTLPIVTHVGDIIFVSVLQYLTLGPSSPFFLYFIFSLFCGAIRWGWQGTLATASAVFFFYLVMGISMIRTLGPREFEIDRFVVRSVYLVVSAMLLVYLLRHEARLRREIERLARWPAATGPDTARLISQVLEHAAAIVGAGRVVVVWDAGDEPAVHIARWSADARSLTTHPPGPLNPPVTFELESATFLCLGTVSADAAILVSVGSDEFETSAGSLHAEMLPWIGGCKGLASAPIGTERVSGRVFFTDLDSPAGELVPLTEVVARELGASLAQLYVTEHMKELAAGEERIRMAHDLHDGVLQSLTGIRLEIRAVGSALDATPTVRDRLFAVERALAMEQRELRFFIGGLGPAVTGRDNSTLAARLNGVRERIALEWQMPVTIRLRSDAALLPERIDRAVPLMVHEAIVNAVKHGQPSRIAVTLDSGPGELRIVVADDGHGFPFRGRYDHSALAGANAGPQSLIDRVAALGGQMSIESTDAGSRVEMVLAL